MTAKEVHIHSYFSLETDLAEQFRSWPEFVGGEDYNVTLKAGEGALVVRIGLWNAAMRHPSLLWRAKARVIYSIVP